MSEQTDFYDESQLTPEEKWEKATIANNFIFYYVMHNNPDICQEVIERLLQIEIDHIEMVQEDQKKITPDSKGIRMDVYVKNSTQVFDLEMQAADTKELAERARYYQGIIDVDTLKSGEFYSKLKDSHIIFICLKDIFNKGFPAYNFENLCIEDTNIQLKDRSYKHFFIANNYDKIEDEKQKNFLKLVLNNEQTDELSQKILAKIKSAKQNIRVRKDYMDFEREKAYAIQAGYERGMEIGMEKGIEQGIEKGIKQGMEKGIEQGIEKGIKQGMEKGIEKGIEQGMEKGKKIAKLETIIIAIKELNISPELAAEKFDIPLAELQSALAD